MSELLKKLAEHLRGVRNPDIHVVSGQNWTEEESRLADAIPKAGRAKVVDPRGTMDGVSVGEERAGRLACFMDGIERMHVPLYISMVPMAYGYVSAAIRARGEDKRMSSYRHKFEEALYFPHRLIDPELLSGAGIRLRDTETEGRPLEEHPMILREAARMAISKQRGRIEAELVREWLAHFDGADGWLVVDGSLGGTLGGDYEKYRNPNIIGLVKSHQTQYFQMEEQRGILGLRPGERSGVFQPLGREDRAPVYSWYLRMRPNAGQDIYFGLIRVEAPAEDRTLEMADEISRWILAERAPLSLPDSRWDKMIYPIRDCELFLRSLAPNRTVLEASLSGINTRE